MRAGASLEARHLLTCRSFSLLTLAGVGLVLGSTWAPAGSSIAVALFNGGAPGVVWEFLVVSMFYWIVAASIAELASAIPSAGGVYHWASVTPGPKFGRVVGFFAGYWNWLAWTMGAASITSVAGMSEIAQSYKISHLTRVFSRKHCRADVCCQPSCLCTASMARLCRIHHHYLVRVSLSLFRKQNHASLEWHRNLLHHVRRLYCECP